MASNKLTPDEIVARIEAAFPPHTAHAEIFDYQFRVRFQVRSKEGTILATVPDLVLHNLDTEQTLAAVLGGIQGFVEENARAKTVSPAPGSRGQYDPHGEAVKRVYNPHATPGGDG